METNRAADPIETLKVDIAAQEAGEDPTITIWHVELQQVEGSSGEGLWTETFGSREQVQAFFRGCSAMSVMLGHGFGFREPDIPRPKLGHANL